MVYIEGSLYHRRLYAPVRLFTKHSRAELPVLLVNTLCISERILWPVLCFNVLMEIALGSRATGRIQLNSNVVVQDQSLFSLYLSLLQSSRNADKYSTSVSCTERTYNCRFMINLVYPLLSVTWFGGLLLVAKFKWVCCPSSQNCLSGKDRSGDVWAAVPQIRTLLHTETLVILLLFAQIKIKYSLNNPNAIPQNEWGSVSGQFQVLQCLICLGPGHGTLPWAWDVSCLTGRWMFGPVTSPELSGSGGQLSCCDQPLSLSDPAAEKQHRASLRWWYWPIEPGFFQTQRLSRPFFCFFFAISR